MATRTNLENWVFEALTRLGGRASIVAVAKSIWEFHGEEIKSSGDLFYTWQYDMRWAAQRLRRDGRLLPIDQQLKRGAWEIAS